MSHGRLVAEPCNIDEVLPMDGNRLMIRGWALPDNVSSDYQFGTRFTANGNPPLSVDYPIPRPDVQKVFWQRPNAEMCGFTVIVPCEYPNGMLEFRCADSQTTTLARGREFIFIPDPSLHEVLPDEDRRFRVIANRDPNGFLMSGATDALRIKAAYENAIGKGWSKVGAVLDWGCGCGRVARHLAPLLGNKFYGCDIDADNVHWCAANLPGEYKVSTLDSSLPYEDESFDIIYGISVFTHLRKNWEMIWLKELRRVLKPGGSILMTVHGQTTIDFAALEPILYKELTDRVDNEGLAFTSNNSQLDGFVDCPSEYVNVFHSQKHIQDVWGQFFVNIKQLPGYIFTHDLVIATKENVVQTAFNNVRQRVGTAVFLATSNFYRACKRVLRAILPRTK